MTRKIAIISGKGGVGKSTIAINLAYALKQRGYSVGLFDADVHGPSIPKLVGLEKQFGGLETKDQKLIPIEKKGVKIFSIGFMLPTRDTPVVWRGPMKHGFIKQAVENVEWGKLDYLVIDLPPGTGDEALSVATLAKPDGVIVVTTPQTVALEDVRKAINFARELSIPIIGVIENMSGFICPYCSKKVYIFGKGGGSYLANEMGVPFLGSIPLSLDIVKSGENGEPFVFYENEASKEFNKIVDKVLKNLVIITLEKELEKKAAEEAKETKNKNEKSSK